MSSLFEKLVILVMHQILISDDVGTFVSGETNTMENLILTAC